MEKESVAKPKVDMRGGDPGFYNLMGAAIVALQEVGQKARVYEMLTELAPVEDYTEGQRIIEKYVDVSW